MNTKSLLNMKIILLTMLLVPGGPLVAQQPADEAESTEQAEEASAEQNGDDEEQEEASDPDLPDIDSEPIDSAQSQGPGRFIPSEQISQDFGVSFPVDI